jgi:WD40 repeat protein
MQANQPPSLLDPTWMPSSSSLDRSPDGSYLASGANDNTLCITDSANMHLQDSVPKFVLTDHQAAVKALAWSPHERNLLASGGGTADRSIKFWNAASGALINSVDTGSQGTVPSFLVT